jgi:transglutaminase-like putative cysteine protease
MRASVQFQLQVSYAEPVRGLNQILRLTPRGFDSQLVRDWRVDVSPEAELRRGEDANGNIVHACSHDGPLDRLTVTARGVVEIHDADGVLRGLPEKLPPDAFLRDAPATHADRELAFFARNTLANEADRLEQMHLLMGALHKTLAFAPGETDAPRPAAEVFAARAGSARELAQVFVAAARSLGLPARFVSGFFLGANRVGEAGGHHGWAEIFFDPIGWIGFDPALGYSPREKHLRLATGLDYFAAAPRRAVCITAAREEKRAALTVDAGSPAS